MLTRKGKLYVDLTIACFADDDFMILGSGAAQAWSFRSRHRGEENKARVLR